MEPDVHPIREHWLDYLVLEITFRGNFFVKGSINRGESYDNQSKNADAFPWIAHINGNALYALNNKFFNMLVDKTMHCVDIRNAFMNAFDVKLWTRLVTDIAKNWKVYQRYAHKFHYSDYILNFGAGSKPQNATLLRYEYPNAYFVHGPIYV
jgi:hypothetical protein